MAKRQNKGRFHPPRVSGIQKQLRAREANELNKKKPTLKPLDLSKSNWSN